MFPWVLTGVRSVSRVCGLHIRPQIAYAEKFYIVIYLQFVPLSNQHICDSRAWNELVVETEVSYQC